jgi:N6-L-threonylcarbamoyladenine synthase
LAVQQTGVNHVALAGGVSANSELRKVLNEKKMDNWKVFIPKFEYCTDNAAMIAIAGKFLFDSGDFATQAVTAKARMDW